MRKRWGAGFIPPLSTGRSIAQEGARWCRVPNTRKVAKRRGRHSKKLPEIVPEQIAAQADSTGQQRPVRRMFEDEARLGRSSDLRRCWAPVGGRPAVEVQVVREYEYAFAAVSPHDGVLDTLVLPTAKAAAMSVFLAEVAQRHPDEFVLMVLDGAGWHRAKRLQVPANRRRIPLPPWSPQLNPVEHLWDEVREKWFSNRVFASLSAVDEQLVKALLALEVDPRQVASLTGFPWITNILLKAN